MRRRPQLFAPALHFSCKGLRLDLLQALLAARRSSASHEAAWFCQSSVQYLSWTRATAVVSGGSISRTASERSSSLLLKKSATFCWAGLAGLFNPFQFPSAGKDDIGTTTYASERMAIVTSAEEECGASGAGAEVVALSGLGLFGQERLFPPPRHPQRPTKFCSKHLTVRLASYK